MESCVARYGSHQPHAATETLIDENEIKHSVPQTY